MWSRAQKSETLRKHRDTPTSTPTPGLTSALAALSWCSLTLTLPWYDPLIFTPNGSYKDWCLLLRLTVPTTTVWQNLLPLSSRAQVSALSSSPEESRWAGHCHQHHPSGQTCWKAKMPVESLSLAGWQSGHARPPFALRSPAHFCLCCLSPGEAIASSCGSFLMHLPGSLLGFSLAHLASTHCGP